MFHFTQSRIMSRVSSRRRRRFSVSPGPAGHRVGRHAVTAVLAVALVAALAPGAAEACACGCDIFDLGATNAFPNSSESGWSAWLRYDFMNQNKNRVGSSYAPASENADKAIRTSFYTLGAQYMFNADWGVMAEMPIFQRAFTSTGDGTAYAAGSIYTSNLTALGDTMVQGVYSGFSADHSTGLTFGLKLPTGNYTGPYVPANPRLGTTGGLAYDRDTLPGTGSTDLLLGGYHVGFLTRDMKLSYFTQARYDVAFLERAGATGTYRPGNELDAAAGLQYNLGAHGPFQNIAPLMQILASYRDPDSGTAASPNSGFRRWLIGPGVAMSFRKFTLYANVDIPIVDHVFTDVPASGNYGQLVPSAIWQMQLAYNF